MGSSAVNAKATTTNTITTTNNTNVVQSRTQGADAVGLANALGNQLNAGFSTIAAAQSDYLKQATMALGDLASFNVASNNGAQLETSGGGRSISDQAQTAQVTYTPLIIGAAILLAIFVLKGK